MVSQSRRFGFLEKPSSGFDLPLASGDSVKVIYPQKKLKLNCVYI